jgi:hypothetical protein
MTFVPPSCRLPWEFHPALQADRLRLCARLLVHARRDAVRLAREELGDDAWSVGCRAFAFGRRRLARVAVSGEHPWLRILDGSHHFVFLIDAVPVRFYRGTADDAPERTLKRQHLEAEQLGLALGEGAAADLMFRLAVETGPDGVAVRVVFLALRGEEGEVECFWPVPLEEPIATSQPTRGAQLALPGGEGWAPAREVGPLQGTARSRLLGRTRGAMMSAARGRSGMTDAGR